MKHFIYGLVLSAFALFSSTKSWVNRNATVENVFEGDIVLNPAHQRRILKIKENLNIQSFPTAATKDELWENGRVPYEIEISNNGFTALEIKLIENIMLEFQFLTCIKFFRRKNESNYLHIVHDAFECKSFIGYQGRVQRLWLTKDCINRNTVLHELMHAIGFWHEQSRYDRDDYVEILEHNIEEGKESEFLKYRSPNITHPKTDYDYNSIMHYGTHAFSKNGQPTIRAKKPGAEIKRDGLSKIDKEEINHLYRCSINEENYSKKKDENQNTTATSMQKIYASNGMSSTQIQNIINGLQWTLTNSDLYTHAGRNAVMDKLISLANSNVASAVWNPIVCEQITCSWKLPSCANVYLTLLHDGFFLEVSKCGSTLDNQKATLAPKNSGCEFELIADQHPRYLRSHIGYGYEKYKENTFCKWTIRGLNSNTFYLLMDKFELEYNANCTNDYFEVYNGIPSSDDNSGNRYCGIYKNVRPVFSFDFQMPTRLHLHTNAVNTENGFQFLVFEWWNKFSACGSILLADNNVKILQSHSGLESHEYENNYSCRWIIRAEHGKHVKIIFGNFKLEANPNCNFDKLEIYNGDYRNEQNKLGKYCGDEVRQVAKSSGNELQLYFRTDAFKTYYGFWLVYFAEI